jgi:hypothetical protein
MCIMAKTLPVEIEIANTTNFSTVMSIVMDERPEYAPRGPLLSPIGEPRYIQFLVL